MKWQYRQGFKTKPTNLRNASHIVLRCISSFSCEVLYFYEKVSKGYNGEKTFLIEHAYAKSVFKLFSSEKFEKLKIMKSRN